MPNEVVVVETPAYQTRTEYGIRSSSGEIVPSGEYKRLKDLTQQLVSTHTSELDERREGA